MKKTIMFSIVLTVIIMMSTGAFAQNAPIDFEAGGYGADWTWTVFENDTNPPVEIIANPDMSAPNESATVAQFTALQTGQPWAGCETLHGADIGTFDLDETNSTIKIMVWKPVTSDVGIKLVKPDGWALPEIKVANTLINQWEELTFDFSSQMETGYDQIVIFPDFDLAGRTQDNICYFDNITFSEGSGGPEGPEVAAPDPTHNAADVVSIYSDSYTDIEGTNFNPGWGQTTIVTFEDIGGNEMMRYTEFNYQGTELAAAQDLSGMDYMHVDMWTADATVVKVTPISSSSGEFLVSLEPITSGSWNSYDIPLADFTGVSMTDIFQLKFDGQEGVTPSTIYLDNIYFYNSQSSTQNNTVSANFVLDNNYPNPFNPTTNINFSINETSKVTLEVFNIKGEMIRTLIDSELEANSHSVVWNGTDDSSKPVSSGVYFYKMKAGNYQETKKMILLK